MTPNIGLQRTARLRLAAAEAGSFAALKAVVLLAISLGSGCTSTRSAHTTSLEGDDRAILTAVLSDPYMSSAPAMSSGPMLQDHTDLTPVSASSATFRMAVKKPSSGAVVEIEDVLIQSLIDRNRSSRASLEGVRLPAGWTLISGATKPGNAVNRIVILSLPGISADGHRAIVSVERDYNRPCCPEGYAVLLEKRNDAWVIEGHGGEWIV